MNKKIFFFAFICLGVSLLPNEVFASTKDYGAVDITAEASKIKDFLFGPMTRFVGVLGGGYGVMMAVLNSSVQPLVTYGGIGLGINLLPKFIDAVFVSGMLLN